MKTRKTVKNQALIQEVISLISICFSPKVPGIKKAIDTLLEKEYTDGKHAQHIRLRRINLAFLLAHLTPCFTHLLFSPASSSLSLSYCPTFTPSFILFGILSSLPPHISCSIYLVCLTLSSDACGEGRRAGYENTSSTK